VFEQELTRSEKIKRSKFFLPILLLVAAGGITALIRTGFIGDSFI
jgi:hypothetical protein